MAFEIIVPQVTFKTRIQTDQNPGYDWKDVSTLDLFKGQRVALFALPGAWTPTCSSTHLPGYEMMYDELIHHGVSEVYCLSVNDAFTMNAWFRHQEVKKVKPIPDGSCEFTRRMGMMVMKDNLGFGARSWRYSMIINDGVVEMMWIEPGMMDNAPLDPFEISDAGTMLAWLKKHPK
jgi:thioredoxin-dependent peroxiredoxin